MTPSADNGDVIGKLGLSASSELVFSIFNYRGKWYAGVRKFVDRGSYQGPTKSGLALPAPLLGWLISELEAFRRNVPELTEQEVSRTSKRANADLVLQTVPPRKPSEVFQLDVREFIQTERYTGPTRKGIRFSLEDLPQVLTLLKQLRTHLRDKEKSQPSLFDTHDPGSGKVSEPPTEYKGADQVVSGILPDGPKRFPGDFLNSAEAQCEEIQIPRGRIRLGQATATKQEIVSEDGVVYTAKNLVEGKYILYAHLAGSNPVRLLVEPFEVFKAVKQYEVYLRGVRARLVQAYLQHTGHRPTAEHFARQAFASLGLPWD